MVLKKILFLILGLALVKTDSCGLGCQKCQQDQCILCLQNFELDISLGLCVYKSCEQNFYFQPSLDLNYQSGKCQSLCDLSYIGNSKQNICVQIAQCSVSNEIGLSIPQNQDILDVQIYQNEFLSIIYSQQIQLFSIDNLEFYSGQAFQSGDLKAFNINGNIILQGQDNSISIWDLTQDKRQLLIDSQTHFVGQYSQFSFLNNNILFVLTYNQANNKIGVNLVDFSTLKVYEYSFQLSSSVVALTLVSNYIVIQSKQGIQIFKYSANLSNLQVEFYEYQYGNACSQFNSTNIISAVQVENKLIIALEDNILIYDLNQQSCQALQLKINLFTQVEAFNQSLLIQSNQTLYMISQLDQKNQEIYNIGENIVDFNIVQLPNNNQEILILFGNNTLQIYQQTEQQSTFKLIFTEILIDQNFQQIIIFQSDKQNLNANNQQFYQFSLVGQFVYIFKRNFTQNTVNSHIIGNYQMPFPTPVSQAVDIAILYSYMQLVSCHQNGDIIFYDISAAQSVELIIKLNFINSVCKKIFTFLDQNLIVQMSDRILIIEGKDWVVLQEIAISSQTQNVKITSNNNQLAIILDLCMKILDESLAYIYDQCQNQFLANLKQIIISSNSIYIQTPTSLSIYQFNKSQGGYQQISAYPIQNNLIQYFTFFKFYQSEQNRILNNFDLDVLIIYDNQFNINILNSDLSVNYVFQNIQFSKIFQVLRVMNDLNSYFVIGLSAQLKPQSQLYLIQIGVANPIKMYSEPNFPYIDQTIYTKNNYDNQNYYSYDNIFFLNQLTVFLDIVCKVDTKLSVIDNYISGLYRLMGQSFLSSVMYLKGTEMNTLQFLGTQQGAVAQRKYITQKYQRINIQNSFKNSQDLMQDFQQSNYLGKYLIRTKQQVSIYNLYTNEFIEYFQADGVSLSFNKCQIIDKIFSIICFNNNQVAKRQYFSQDTTNYFKTDNQITGFIYDENLEQIITYGDEILQLDLNLNTFNTLQIKQQGRTVFICQTSLSVLVCMDSKLNLIIFNKSQNYQKQTIPQSGFQNTANIIIDEDNQNILIIQQTVYVFSFQGIIKKQFQLDGSVIQYSLQEDFIIIATKLHFYIIRRDNMIQQVFQAPSSFGIVKYVYVNYNQQIGFFCDSITVGQLFLYNIHTQQIAVIQDSQQGLAMHILVDIFYDSEKNVIVFIDTIGQIVCYSLSGSDFSLFNIAYISEIKDSQEILMGLSVDFNQNSLFIYSNTHIYLMSYGLFGYQFKLQLKEYNNFFCEMKLLNDNLNQIQFLLVSKQGLIYRFKQNSQQLQQELVFTNKQIIDIRYDIDNDILIVAFQNQIILFYSYESNFRNNLQSKQTIISIEKFQKFLTNSIYQTWGKQIIHIDIKSASILKIIQLNGNQFITSFMFDQSTFNLYVGLSDQSAFIYNTENLFIKSYLLGINGQINGQVKFINMINSFQISFATNYGQLFIVDMNQDKIIQHLNLTQIAQKQQDQFLTNQVYDNLFDRIFFQFISDNKVYAFGIQTQMLEGIIGISDDCDTSIQLTSKFVIVSSSFQLNFYSRTQLLVFKQALIRKNLQNNIISYYIIQDQFVILLHSDHLEVFVLQNNDNFIIDARQYNYPKIIKIIKEDQNIYIFGFHNSGVFEIKYNTQIYMYNYNKQSQNYGKNIVTQCYFDPMITSNSQQILSQINQILPITSQSNGNQGRYPENKNNTNIFLYINLSSQQVSQFIKQISDSNQINQILLSKSKFDQNDLVFDQSINFRLKKNDFQIQGFNIQIEPIHPQEPINITFDESVQNSILDSISFINQDISNTQITFMNQQNIVLSNILIHNCTAKNGLNSYIQALIYIQNVTSFVIYNLVITDNYFSSSNDLKQLFYIYGANQIIINNIQIKNNFQNQNYSIFQFILSQNILIDSINVNNNTSILQMSSENSNQFQKIQNQQSPIINIISSNYTMITNSTFIRNYGLPILKNINYAISDDLMLILLNDLMAIKACQFQDNKYDQSFSVVQLESSNVKIEILSWERNTGNFLIQKAKIVNIINSVFNQNTAIDGGALYLYNIQNFTSFENSTFTLNKAEGSGGSIYIFNENYQCTLYFDKLTKIFQNRARIGGGVRILNNMMTSQISQDQLFQSNIYQNSAEIYGDDLATYIQEIKIDKYIIDNSQQKIQNFTFEINSNLNQNPLNYKDNMYSKQINISNFTSGGKIQMQVFYLDSYKRKITFNKGYLDLAKYPKLINEELISMQISVESLSSTSVQLTGDKQINYILYDEQTSSFLLTDLTISAQISSSFYFSINTFLQSIYQNQLPILMLIEFRPCFVGEVVQLISDNIQICKFCSSGTYSLQDPLILLQNSSDSAQYLENQCKLSFNIFCLLCYFLYCEKTIMSNNIYSSTCYYLRQLNFLPVLKNSFRDLSGYYIKIILTFLQLSSILTSSHDVFSLKLDFPFIYIGSSSYNISVGLSCILGQEIFRTYGKIKVVLLVYSLIPISFLITIQLILGLKKLSPNVQPNSKRMLYYRALTYIHLLYFFFLTDSIQFFSSSLNCVQIGSESYQSIDTTVLCSDLNYKTHIYFVSYFQLSLFSLLPLIILFQIRRHKNTLNYCTIKYIYGYYYNEFKIKYYYWEIMRIYIKILVIYINSLLGYYDKDIANNIIIAFMAFYLKILYKNKPYITKDLNQKEIQTVLLIQYTNNFNTRFSKILRYILKKLLPQKISQKILNIRQVSFKTFQRWKLIKKKLRKIIKLKAQFNMKNLKKKLDNIPKKPKVSISSYHPLTRTRLSTNMPKSPILKSSFYQNVFSQQKLLGLNSIGNQSQYDSPFLKAKKSNQQPKLLDATQNNQILELHL
ncbi:hypothetical protein ABPG73_018905 [Tetrahymena malaccensis]